MRRSEPGGVSGSMPAPARMPGGLPCTHCAADSKKGDVLGAPATFTVYQHFLLRLTCSTFYTSTSSAASYDCYSGRHCGFGGSTKPRLMPYRLHLARQALSML